MLDTGSLGELRNGIRETLAAERGALDELRRDVHRLRSETRRIHPHSTTAISLVGTDGGNNVVQYDPFMIQVVRVVDSSNNEYCLEVVTPRTPIASVDTRHLDNNGRGLTSLGRLMELLNAGSLADISSMIPSGHAEPKASWVQVYRELMEWATLLDLVRNRAFATDTVIIQDGLLRTKVFTGDYFKRYRDALDDAIAQQYKRTRRRLYVVGIAKHSKVLQTYQLAMALESVLRNAYASFLAVPRELEEKVYKYSEYARGDDRTMDGGEINKFVAGKMFFVKFGNSPLDAIWAVDVLQSQVEHAPQVMGYLLSDALDGFPIPFYPQSLQRAHENAALVDLDMDLLQDGVLDALRDMLGEQKWIVDESRLQLGDVSARRYS